MTDPPERINRFVQEEPFSFKIAMAATPNGEESGALLRYRVLACPTTYLLDAAGKVAFRALDFDEKGLRAALKRLGTL